MFLPKALVVMLSTLSVAVAADALPPPVKRYTALTPAVALAPGEVTNAFHRLPIPSGPIAVYRFAADVVETLADGTVAPTPTFDAYLHHHVVASNFGDDNPRNGRYAPMKPANVSRSIAFGAGTEARGTPQQFPFPYAFVTEEGEDEWIANVHIINTRGMSSGRAHHCLECPCTSEDEFTSDAVNGLHVYPDNCNAQLRWENNTACAADTYYGGLKCCEDGEFCLEQEQLDQEASTTSTGAYQLRYTLEYAEVTPANRLLYLAGCCDASGDLTHTGNIEYDVPLCDPETHPGCVHTLSTRQSLDMNGKSSIFNGGGEGDAPDNADNENREVELVYAVGHQHRGGLGIEMYDDATGELLCASVPSYGTGDVAGNEYGYVVAMSTCSFDPPRRMRASDIVRIVALYNNTVAHTGVMSLMYMALSDVEQPAGAAQAVAAAVNAADGDKTSALHAMALVAGAGALVVLAAVAWKRMKARTGSYAPLLSMPPTSLPPTTSS